MHTLVAKTAKGSAQYVHIQLVSLSVATASYWTDLGCITSSDNDSKSTTVLKTKCRCTLIW